MSAILNRLERAEQAAGLVGGDGLCEACELRVEWFARMVEKDRAWGLEPYSTDPARCIRGRCYWCGVAILIVHVLSPAEAADFERWEAYYWRGEACGPEYEALRASVHAAIDRALEARYGEHADEMRADAREYGEALAALRQAPMPYVCRRPGCDCDAPKTLAEWHRRVTANGYRVKAAHLARRTCGATPRR